MIDMLFSINPLIREASASFKSEIYISGLITSVLLPVTVILALLAIGVMGNRIKYLVYQILSITLAMGVLVWLLFFALSPISGSTTMTYLALAFDMAAVVFILGFMKLSPLDYAILFTSFVCVSRFVSISLFGIALYVLYIFITLLAVCKIRFGCLQGRIIHIWFTSMFVSMEWYVCEFLFKYVKNIGYAYNLWLQKLFVWGVVMLVIVIASLAVIYMVKRLCRKPFDEINQMGKAYPRVERFFVYATVAILVFIALSNFSYKLLNGFYGSNSPSEDNLRIAIMNNFSNSIDGLFNLFTLLALIIQVSFLIMLFKITRLKDILHSKTLESQSLLAYSSGLEKNMDDIRNIKHDIKNIFLTMSGFVERSGDVEMQTYYYEKISPFAKEEIVKSDFYGKLAAINNEQIKAFLFYKISQAVGFGIALDLEISPRFSVTDVLMEIVDLVRTLGILMDNAIEECLKVTHGVITVKLTQNDELVSYAIKNTVSHETRRCGVKSGVSMKGSGRGNGLIIVRNILEKYDCVTLNSYFQEDSFVQSLVIYSN